MKELHNILNTFDTIGLEEMDSVKLMDRMDTKYSFSLVQLPLVLEKLNKDYFVLNISENKLPGYKTLYFDTPSFELYHKHHSGALNRYKIRYRNYVESNLAFLEVKFKNNKGRTIKDRIKYKHNPEELDERSGEFIQKKTPYTIQSLKPVIWINYNRITLVDKQLKERVTIDVNLEFNHQQAHHKMENLVIAEVKQVGKLNSKITHVLKEQHIRQTSLSKYCMGMTYIYPQLKKNNFKQKLNSLNKIMYDHSFKPVANF